ncbi:MULTISPECIES: TadE/TadG family type IV pilus assembly protein [unclassified Mesorhizobium]|uniref:TadE/TadG family type IV pilus assembly protein n=1 Tax=unclassified Mesorhizobium TaxID=325217 RepID=UPI000FCA76E0|nr:MULTISPECIES: TadE/TadG family type IV pilus assembly protein [unclassified Mesorhizobium]TGP24409.1 pilus assembly protein [Mesorhizobium sp. M1D.F.Ca.ET.231.01.1.1]TGP35003.1 pilus assembly protein [Mesorhizobium sp. M1D.F.Ca.ET.234.01.1.1]TGS49026.1 pilus assembly protein [Mesorhizobium sp. M1D.F.Ca.ET.184.01.1.1]TGS63226.1 pilus assembly protein [Mesorhizobium sp. M1D.F.Ca.ET.183.01.1.1]
MFSSARDFVRSQNGSMMPIMVIMTIPLLIAVGFSVDYTSAVTTRSNMQNALDAAILSITTMETTTSKADRQVALQQAYAANNGDGTVTLQSVDVAADGTASFSATAAYPMPTNFMTIANIKTVAIGVGASVRKTPALTQADFKVTKVSGYWNKTMYLYGTKFAQTNAQSLMKIDYKYVPYQFTYKVGTKSYTVSEPKGYGTTSVYTVNGTTQTQVQQQTCTTTGSLTAFSNPPAGSIPGSVKDSKSGKTIYFNTTCATTTYPANGAGAAIDVSQMDKLYLQMDVPSGNPQTLKSDDAATSNRLYIGTSETDMPEVATGEKVDIFSAVPCNQTSYQAWEDGGNPVPADVSNADFFYNVTGKCAFNKRQSETVMTQ